MFEPDSSSQIESERNPTSQQLLYSGQMEISGSKNGETKEKVPLAEVTQDQLTADSDNTLSSTTETMSTKPKIEKVCRVCGDKAKSFHFGGLSCDSCKAFFRRSVHNSAFESFQCTGSTPGIPCAMSLNSRKSCQFCRFQKCLTIGMEKKWVMSEEERTNLNKQRKEKKGEKIVTATITAATTVEVPRNKPTGEDKYEPDIAEMLKFLTIEERDQIESVVQKYQHAYREMPFTAPKDSETRNPVEIVGMFTTILRRFAYFAKLLPEFCNLCVDDQSTLLRGGVLEMCLLRSAIAFDVQNNRWPRTDTSDYLKDCPQLKVEDMERLVSKELFQMHMKFINGIQELKADEPVVMVLLLIVLFHPERANVQDPGYVSEVQEKYVQLLEKYTQWRYGPTSSKAFPKLLTKLADLRELNDSHTEYNIKISKKEVDTIQEQLGQINLNPYPQWVLVQDQRAGRGQQQTKAMKDVMMGMGHNFPGPGSGGGLPGGIPSTRELFMNFVNNKIPALIENPFVPMDMGAEMAAGMASLAAMGGMSGMSGMAGNMFQQFQQNQQQQQQFPIPGQIPNNLLDYQFPPQTQPLDSSAHQLMEEFLNSDRSGGGMQNINMQSFFTSGGPNPQFYGQNYTGNFSESPGVWQDVNNTSNAPVELLHDEFTFPSANEVLEQNSGHHGHGHGHGEQNWRHTPNY